MKKTLATIALLAASAMPGQASASAVYEFKTLTNECRIIATGEVVGPICGGTFGLDDVNGLRVGISGSEGILEVKTRWYGGGQHSDGSYYNSNVTYTNFERVGTRVDLETGLCFDHAISPHFCTVDALFLFSDALDVLIGHLYTLNDLDQISMSSHAGSAIWSGFYGSDSISSRRQFFTGVWYEVPEPGSLALLGVGLLGMMGLRQRRVSRSQC